MSPGKPCGAELPLFGWLPWYEVATITKLKGLPVVKKVVPLMMEVPAHGYPLYRRLEQRMLGVNYDTR
jgi:hypothetical protein